MAKKKPEQQPEQPKDIREMTADSLGRDLLSALVQEIKLLPKPWASLTKSKQDDIIDRLRDRVEYNVKMAVHLIASNNRTTVIGDLESVTSKDGIKAQFKINQNSEGRHHLFDSVGHACLIVVADASEHTGGMDDVQGESDQRSMDLGKEYTDQDGDGMDDDSDVVDAEFKPAAIEHQPLQSELDQAWDDGYDAAEEGKPQTDCPVMAGPLCIQWVKGWKAWHEENPGEQQDADETEGQQS
ncbi:cell division protein FtsK [Paracandidimonas lactea]|uniref:cell division protein FtsK n=1 Tax=Paracandidimonas lactea TaxID=2895524 RepID=UPI001F22B5F4|nr:cell division protein FtsK [Paracandidimonas lactea]